MIYPVVVKAIRNEKTIAIGTVHEVCKKLNISDSTIYSHMDTGIESKGFKFETYGKKVRNYYAVKNGTWMVKGEPWELAMHFKTSEANIRRAERQGNIQTGCLNGYKFISVWEIE